MFDHISLGVSDLARSIAFYDAALAPLGVKRLYTDGDDAAAYGVDRFLFWIVTPLDTVHPASAGNGCHVAFSAPDHASVDAFHAKALTAGGQDNGKPGLRPQYTPDYYAAFVIDPDGNKIEAVNRAG